MEDRGAAVLVAILLIAIGLVSFFMPEQTWRATEGWKYRNPSAVEPSEAGYAMRQLGGVVMILVAAILLILAATQGPPKPKFQPFSNTIFLSEDAAVAPNTIAPGEPGRVVTGNIRVPNTDPVATEYNFYLTVIDDDGSQVAWRHIFTSVPAGTTREFSPTAAFVVKDLPDGEYRWTVTTDSRDKTPISDGTFTIGPPLR